MWSIVAMLMAILLAHDAGAQDAQIELTPAGKADLQNKLAAEADLQKKNAAEPGRVLGLFLSTKPPGFPSPTCMFVGGLCGAVRRDGSVAVQPRYDWVDEFADGRAAVRLGGLYGFVDEDGREIVMPQYRIVGDYKFGFAQVDVDGKSGLIDRDGKMVIEPKYGFIEAIASDRFRVSEQRRIGGRIGGEDFSGNRTQFTPSGGAKLSILVPEVQTTGVIDISGRWIEPLMEHREFDKDDPSIHWVQKDKLWGLARADGSWLVEPKFQQSSALSDGLALVTLNDKVGFIDRTGNLVIEPVFDEALPFAAGLGRTSAQRDGISGVIDKTGAWVFQTDYQKVLPAFTFRKGHATLFGWRFKKAEQWGLLDIDGHVVLNAGFDLIQRCDDGRLATVRDKEPFIFKADGSPLQPPDGQFVNAGCGDAPYILKTGDKFGLVDAELRPLTPVQFEAIVWAGRDARNVKLEGKWGRIGPDGHWIIQPKFSYLSNDGDILVAAIDSKRGFMRSDGSWLIEPKFDAARRRRDADTAFVTTDGATGLLRVTDQSWIIAPRAGVMCDARSAIMSQNNGKRVILSPSGETWIDIDAERIGIPLDVGLLTFLRDDKWGLTDTAGQVTAEPQFDEPVYFAPSLRGIAWAKQDRRWCAIDRRGRSVPGIACADEDPLGSSKERFKCQVEP
jgi:WG containing repeat